MLLSKRLQTLLTADRLFVWIHSCSCLTIHMPHTPHCQYKVGLMPQSKIPWWHFVIEIYFSVLPLWLLSKSTILLIRIVNPVFMWARLAASPTDKKCMRLWAYSPAQELTASKRFLFLFFFTFSQHNVKKLVWNYREHSVSPGTDALDLKVPISALWNKFVITWRDQRFTKSFQEIWQ